MCVEHPPFRIHSFFVVYQNQSHQNIDDTDADIEHGSIFVVV